MFNDGTHCIDTSTIVGRTRIDWNASIGGWIVDKVGWTNQLFAKDAGSISGAIA
jgi:hypothetical protein